MLQNSFPELQQGPEGSPKCSQFGQKLAKRLEIEACAQKKSQKLIIFQEVPHMPQNCCSKLVHMHTHTHTHTAHTAPAVPSPTRPRRFLYRPTLPWRFLYRLSAFGCEAPRPNHWAPWASWTLWVPRGSGSWSGGPRALVALGSGPTVPSSGLQSNSLEPWVLVQWSRGPGLPNSAKSWPKG